MANIEFNNILGKDVVFVAQGKRLGKITRIAIDQEKRIVKGFILERGTNEELSLPVQNVSDYGKDAVTVSTEKGLSVLARRPDEDNSVILGRKIIGLPVLTEKGEAAGEVFSFHFDPKTAKITYFEISGGPFKDMMEGRGLLSNDGVVSLGPDVLVVKEVALTVAKDMKPGPGLKQKISQVKVKAEEILRSMKGKREE